MTAVRFTGCPTRSGPLMLGQHIILRALLRSAEQIAMVAVLPMPGGVAPQTVADAVGALCCRHDALRTTYRLGEPPRQVVAASGEFEAVVRQAGGGTAQTAESLGQELWAPLFDLERELPLRLGLVVVNGVVSHAVLAVSHMAADGQAMGIMIGELDALLAGRDLPAPGLQPIDVAEMERDPALTRRTRASIDYWADQLRRAPHNLFRPKDTREDPSLPSSLAIHSTDLAAAIAQSSRRARVSVSTVALTAMAVLAALRAGSRGFCMSLSSANRSLPGTQTLVGTVAMEAFMTADPWEQTSFDTAARAIGRGALKAYWNALYDSTDLWSAIAAIGRERGIVAYRRDVVFNDMSVAGGALMAAGWAGPIPEKPPARTHFSWYYEAPKPSRLALNIYRLTDQFVASLWGDPAYLSRADVLNFGHAMTRLLGACADGDIELADVASLAGFPEEPAGPGWVLSDGGWIELDRVRELLREVLGDRSFVLSVKADETLGHRLVCQIVDEEGSLRPEAIHGACLTALARHPSAVAPHHYVFSGRTGS